MPSSPGSVGASVPIQPFEFATPAPLGQTPTITYDEDSNDWWGGVQKCFVQVAIATTIAATALTTQLAQPNFDPQEMPPISSEDMTWQHQIQPPTQWNVPIFVSSAGAAPGQYQVEEDFWQNPVAPVVWPNGRLYLPDPEEIPTGNLSGAFNEDFWQNPVAPVSSYPVPFVFNTNEDITTTATNFYEDLWQHQIQPPDNRNIPIYGSSIAAAPSSHQPDEDYWQHLFTQPAKWNVPLFSSSVAAAPLPPVFHPEEESYQPQLVAEPLVQFIFFTEDGSAVAGIQPDEDFWQNPVPLVLANNFIALPYLPDSDQLVVSAVTGQPDEDFWKNPVAPVPATNFIKLPYLPDPEELFVPGVAPGQPDEDYWQNPVPPVAGSNFIRLPYLPDPEEIKVSPPATINFDEDFWQHQIQPPTNRLIPMFGSSEAAAPGTPPFQLDEEIYIPPIIPEPLVQFIFFTEDGSAVAGIQPDEDFWQNPVAPVSSYPVPFVFNTNEDITLPTVFDEDFWQNPVAPTWSYPIPAVFIDAAELPQAIGEPDEDFWENSVLPVAASNYVPLPYLPDHEEIPAGNLRGCIDEDFWTNPVAPVVGANFIKLPYLPDPEELTVSPFPPGQPDEDFWQNPVAPVVAANYVRLPYLPDPEEIPAGNLRGAFDEDFWQNQVRPVASYPVPAVFRADDEISVQPAFDEDFWQNPVRPVASYAPPAYFIDDDTWPTPPPPVHFLDEDFWQNPVAPVVWPNGRLYLPDPQGRHFILPFTVRGSGRIQEVRGSGQVTKIGGSGKIETVGGTGEIE